MRPLESCGWGPPGGRLNVTQGVEQIVRGEAGRLGRAVGGVRVEPRVRPRQHAGGLVLVEQLNRRPRKTLDFRTPAEVFDEAVALIA